jgi:hypothetical protein
VVLLCAAAATRRREREREYEWQPDLHEPALHERSFARKRRLQRSPGRRGELRGVTSLTRLPRTTLLIGISIVIVLAMLFANSVLLGDADDNKSVSGWIGFSLFGIAVSAVLLLVAIPRLPADARPTAVLGFGIGAVVTCLFFWSALPFALGVAAIAAAAPARPAEGSIRPESASAASLACVPPPFARVPSAALTPPPPRAACSRRPPAGRCRLACGAR